MSLATRRAALKDALNDDGTNVESYVPELITPPAIVVVPGSPYIIPGETFGSWRIRWELTLVSEKASNLVETEKLDELIEATLDKLEAAQTNYTIREISKPSLLPVNNATFLSTVVTVTESYRKADTP